MTNFERLLEAALANPMVDAMQAGMATAEAIYSKLDQQTVGLITGPVPEVGQRHDALMEVAYRSGEFGLTNDEILILLDALCGRWGKHPGVYERWTALLAILRRVRGEFPNRPDGSGYRQVQS